jgi:hypothetical protein
VKKPVKVSTVRAHQDTAEAAVREVIEVHGEPCEVVILCTEPGSSEEMRERVMSALAVDREVSDPAVERDQLRAALRHFGEHQGTCPAVADVSGVRCICGLSALLGDWSNATAPAPTQAPSEQ